MQEFGTAGCSYLEVLRGNGCSCLEVLCALHVDLLAQRRRSNSNAAIPFLSSLSARRRSGGGGPGGWTGIIHLSIMLSTTEPEAFQRWTRWEGTPFVGDSILFDPPRRAEEASQRARGWHLAIAAALLFGGPFF